MTSEISLRRSYYLVAVFQEDGGDTMLEAGLPGGCDWSVAIERTLAPLLSPSPTPLGVLDGVAPAYCQVLTMSNCIS